MCYRYCQFEIPVIVVGTKSDVVLALTEEMNATLAFLKTHYEVRYTCKSINIAKISTNVLYDISMKAQ
jgi:hypothetical protein